MKFSLKRILSFVLALVMVLGMIPDLGIRAHAAGTLNTVSDLGASWTDASNKSGKAEWTSSGTTITGTATGYKSIVFSNTITTTLTLTNNKSGEAKLTFDYSLSNGGSVAFKNNGATDNGTKNADGTTTWILAKEKSLVITLTSPKGASTNTLSITGISLVLNASGDINTTFKPAANGSYTLDGVAVTAETKKTGPVGSKYTVAATPASGYKLLGWYNETSGKFLSNAASYTMEVDTDFTVYPKFVSAGTPIFQVGPNELFLDLDDAVNFASANGKTQVTLISSGTISDASYTIPSGITVLIPHDDSYVPKGAKPQYIQMSSTSMSFPGASAYVTLTMADNTKITVEGTGVLEVSAPHAATAGGLKFGNAPVYNYGAIYMNSGSQIIMNGTSTLYAWGYIYGNGSVTANNGTSVYEYMQINDFCGGSNLGDLSKVFPFSQYYVQNIEVPLTLNYGAKEYVCLTMIISSYVLPAAVQFIGPSNCMFTMASGSSVTKDYDHTTDKLILDINGSASMQSVSIAPDLSAFTATQQLAIKGLLYTMLGSETINSENYILPINSNFTFYIHSGTTTISQELSVLPGVEITVDEGANLVINSGDSSKTTLSTEAAGKNVYLFDSEQLNAHVFGSKKLITAAYSPSSGRYIRGEGDLKDVKLDINGTVTTNGFLYTSVEYEYEFDENDELVALNVVGGGANITSSEGTGKFVMENGAGTELGFYHLNGTGAATTEIMAASAQLKNADGTYLNTMGAEAGAQFQYCAECGKWTKIRNAKVTFDANTGSGTMDAQDLVNPYCHGEELTPNKFTKDAHIFSGWNTAADGKGTPYADKAVVKFEEDTTLYAIWEAQPCKLFLDGTELGEIKADEKITDKLGKPLDAFRFYSDEACTKVVDITEDKMPEHNLYAKTLYTLTFQDENGEVIAEAGGKFVAGEKITAPTYTPKKENYVFTAWVEDAEGSPAFNFTNAVMPARNLTVDAQVMQSWTVKFELDNEVVHNEQANKENDFSVTINFADPTKDGYIFKGWYDGSNYYKNGDTISKISNNMVLTAKFEVECDHSNTKPVSNGDGTHDIVCTNTECKAVVKDNVSCSGGTATCVAQAECSVCKTAYGKLGDHTYTKNLRGELKTPGTCSAEAVYAVKCDNCDFNSTSLSVKGEKAADNHDWYENGYTENTGATHKIVYICRNDGTHTKTSDAIEHTYVDGVCKCNATKTYTIKFDTDGDGKVDVTLPPVAHGTAPEAPAFSLADTAEWDYTFTVWKDADDNKYESVPAATKDMTYTATYTSKKVLYSIQWMIGDKAVVDRVAYGEVPQYTGNTPTQAETAEYTYTFTGWKDADGNAPVAVTGEATYIAQFAPVAKSYTITFANTGDTVMEAKSVAYGTNIGAISEPSKVGHRFTGWTITDADGNAVKITDGKMPAKNLTYTAGWQLNEYTITWKDDEGNLIDTTTVKHGETPTHADPSKDETAQYTYTFAGWGNIVPATGPATYTAQFTPVLRSYDITFVVDGQGDKVVSTPYGQTPVYDADGKGPTKETDAQYKYTFKGWATTEGGEVADLAEVNGIATYYAIFDKTPVKHTITFMDGENVWKRIELDYDAEITDDVKSSEEKTGYTFRGWYTIEKDPETGEDMQVPYTIPEKMGAVDTVVYGNWTINSYTITFMDGETELGKITKNYNEAISAVEYTAWQTKTGYTFNSWSEAVPATMPAGDKTLTGNWTINKYTITFLNTGDTAIDSITQDFGSAVQWPADPVKNGYTFAGWDRDVITTMPAENVEVTASWTANEAVVIFMNGNEEHHRIETTTDANISEQIAAITAPTLEGYVFAGWVDADNNPVSFNKIPAGGMTVYAAFTVDTFKINFYVDDEATTPYASFDVQFGTDLLTATPDNPETEEDESKLSYLDELLKGISVPTKEGHTWKGWNTDDVPATMPAKAVNVYGTWTKNSYKITADGKDYTFEYDAAVSIPNPTKEGHTFNGWNETVPATMPANDLVLTAKWTVNSYTITFDTDGGIETIADINANFGEAVTKPADPTKTGHTFQGWSTDGVNVVNFPATMPAGGLSLKAIWAKNTIYITWIIDGNETIVPYEYGDTITVPEATKADDIKWSYKHTGWKDAEGNAVEAFGTATGPATYTAQFAEDEAVKYTVKFVDPTNEEYGYETKIAWNGEVDLEALEGFTAPTKEGNTLSWTVEGADVSFPYAMTTADVTFVAKWTPNPYTITVDGVEYPSTYGADVSVADPAPQEGKTFTGWTVTKTEDGKEIDPPANMPAYDITYTSNWTVNTYTLTVSSFDANGVSFEKTYAVDYGVDLSGYYLETPSYTDDDGTLYEFDKWSVWTWQNDDDNTMAEYTGTTMPASNVKMYSTYTFTGWYEFVPGFTSYAVKSDIAHYRNEWATIEGAEYYFVFVADKMYSYIVKDITLIDGSYYAFDHASGKFLADTTGIYKATNGDLYWIEDGVAVANKGLVRLVEDGEVHYYYFGNADNAYIAVKAGVYWVNNTNDLLPMWDYTFGEDGVIAHDDALNNNAEQTHKVVSYDDGKYYTIDGIKVHYGLFIGDDGEYYYARSSGQLVANQNYWLSESHLNGVERDGIPVEEGSYKFDAEGRIVWSSDLKNGIYAEDGGLYYYEDGVRTYAGLIELNGNLYYVRTSGQLAVGRYWVTKNNGIMASASYEFDQDGKMIRTNGLINEPDGLFYYVNGNRYHAGLIKYEGDFYYIRTNGQAVTGRTYWISHLNGYDVTDGIKEGIYEFTADGKMIIPEPVVLKNGIHEEDGKLMYYVDGKLNYAGLIQYTGTMTKEDGTEVNYDGAWIYVRTSGELAVGRSYWATKNNGYMKSATYQFDENGIMLNPPV